MFDIDGTLINSNSFEDDNYIKAIQSVLKIPFKTDWRQYENVSDAGILAQIIKENNLEKNASEIHLKVKTIFVKLIKSHLTTHKTEEIPGATYFLEYLQGRKDVEIAIATGGWKETAKLKLLSAGINISGLSFASSSDHIQRIEIMRQAESRCENKNFIKKTYFGDAVWDKIASNKLSYNFVLIGKAIRCKNKIPDYQNLELALSKVGLMK